MRFPRDVCQGEELIWPRSLRIFFLTVYSFSGAAAILIFVLQLFERRRAVSAAKYRYTAELPITPLLDAVL